MTNALTFLSDHCNNCVILVLVLGKCHLSFQLKFSWFFTEQETLNYILDTLSIMLSHWFLFNNLESKYASYFNVWTILMYDHDLTPRLDLFLQLSPLWTPSSVNIQERCSMLLIQCGVNTLLELHPILSIVEASSARNAISFRWFFLTRTCSIKGLHSPKIHPLASHLINYTFFLCMD